jgi:hypothetical protein
LLGWVIVDVFSPPRLATVSSFDDSNWSDSAQLLRDALLVVGMMAALGWHAPSAVARPRPSLRQRLVDLAALPLVGLLCLIIWGDAVTIPRLVLIAVQGIDASEPSKFSDPAAPQFTHGIAVFSSYATMATFAAVSCVLLLYLLTRTWHAGWRVRLPVLALMIAGWAVQAAFVGWVYRDGFRLLSPAFAERFLTDASVWWTAAALTALVSTIVAYRNARLPGVPDAALPLVGRRQRWFHESWLAVALTTLAAAVHNVLLVTEWYLDPAGCLWLAVSVFGVVRLWRIWRSRRSPAQDAAWLLPPQRFVVTWLATTLTIATAAPTLALFSFIYWLGPIVRWRMFELV